MGGDGFRLPGEFEPQDAVMLCWLGERFPAQGHDGHRVFAAVVANLVDEAKVYINCGIPGALDACRAALAASGVDLGRVIFTQFADHLCWARDYGADIMVDAAMGRGRLANFGFNMYGLEPRGGPGAANTRRIAPHQAVLLDCLDIVDSFLISEGGDREVNGQGLMLTIEDTEVRKRNPEYSRAEVEAEFKRILNLDKVIWLPLPTYEDEDIFDGVLDVVDGRPVYRSHSANGHIDEMCRFVAEDTVILAEVTAEEAASLDSARITRERLELAYRVLAEETASDGRPLRVLRMPVPDPIYITVGPGEVIYQIWHAERAVKGIGEQLRDGTAFPAGEITMQPAMSYCNFLVCNGVVLGQKYWREGLAESVRAKDEAAERVLAAAFPGRRIVMIDALAVNILGGGIHCITKNIPRLPSCAG